MTTILACGVNWSNKMMTPKTYWLTMNDRQLIEQAVRLHREINIRRNFGVNDVNDLRNIEEELRIRGYREVDTIDFVKEEDNE